MRNALPTSLLIAAFVFVGGCSCGPTGGEDGGTGGGIGGGTGGGTGGGGSNCSQGQLRPCPGECPAALQNCVGGEWGACVFPQEVCNGVDDDCDGQVDEGFPQVGQTCNAGVGACEVSGTHVCGLDAGPTFCNAVPGLPSVERCDNLDNDCNGQVDDAVPGTGVMCINGLGTCAVSGVTTCTSATGVLACNAVPLMPTVEICDNLDNDCNATTDDVVGLGDACAQGVGQCLSNGTQVCDFNTQLLVCSAMPGTPTFESCNGLDDDCNGAVDNDPADAGVMCSVGIGSCQRAGALVCGGLSGLSCAADAGSPVAEVCDGADNDCNGSVDDLPTDVGASCTVGVGACTNTGVTQCSSGLLSCTGAAGTPSAEQCNGIDDDCNGSVDDLLNCTLYRSCAHAAEQGVTASGTYQVSTTGVGFGEAVYCDFATDFGGWTLVASTVGTTLNDEASAWYGDLRTLAPAAPHTGVWSGLRGLGQRFDVRFACRATEGAANDPMAVDLSFYDVPWYTEMTTGADLDSCLSEANGLGADSRVPARRNNLTGEFRRRGDRYGAGYLEIEDSCGDTNDFTVDFDDRGMDGTQSDGTDWGEDDGSRKCGAGGLATGQWFIFVRERPRVATVGLPASVATRLRASDILTTQLAYSSALPEALTHERFDTVVIGRYASTWPLITQPLKEALDTFGREGGNVVTEFDGATLFMASLDSSYRYPAGAPGLLGWFPAEIGGGNSRGSNTQLTQVEPDGLFAGVNNPFSAGSGTEFFFWLGGGGLKPLATFPGSTANFPNASYGAVFRGRYCDGNAIHATFDWSDAPNDPGFGNFVTQLVQEANLPPPSQLFDQCQEDLRPNLMLCGSSSRSVSTFGSGTVVFSCVPNAQTQAFFVTRTGVVTDPAALRAYVTGGGIVITEYSSSDEIYNQVFNGSVTQSATRSGACQGNIMPVVTERLDDAFWRENRFTANPFVQTGCGFDLSAFPGITPLGGFAAGEVHLAYRDLSRGRVWLVESDWQDGQSLSGASLGLFRYMVTHAANSDPSRGILFSGVRTTQAVGPLIKKGFQVCHSSLYNTTTPLADITSACVGDVLLMGCRPIGADTFTVAAMGQRAEVLTDVGTGANAVNNHNGVNWYFSAARSWGFANGADPVNRQSCDTNSTNPAQRLCWHTNSTNLTSGWRCGSNTNLSTGWERVVMHRSGDLP